jgi:hypothetical protein
MKLGSAPLCITLLILCEERRKETLQNYQFGPTVLFERFTEISSYTSGDWNTPENIAVYLRFSVLHCVHLSSQWGGGSTSDRT